MQIGGPNYGNANTNSNWPYAHTSRTESVDSVIVTPAECANTGLKNSFAKEFNMNKNWVTKTAKKKSFRRKADDNGDY